MQMRDPRSNKRDKDDSIAAFRGVVFGALIGSVFWLIIIYFLVVHIL